MRARHEITLLGSFCISLLALQRCGFTVGIKLDRHARVGELHCRHVHQVSPQHQLLALAFDCINTMSGRVATACDRFDAWYKVRVAIKWLELIRFDVRVYRGHCALEETFRVRRCLVQVRLAEPEIGVVLVRANDRVGECKFVTGHQAADVVCMHMCDVDFVDLLGLIAGSLQIRDEIAQRRAK